jgi:hypothetical protein
VKRCRLDFWVCLLATLVWLFLASLSPEALLGADYVSSGVVGRIFPQFLSSNILSLDNLVIVCYYCYCDEDGISLQRLVTASDFSSNSPF